MITATGFFCEACLLDKPLDDLSKDERYCISCFAFLSKEAKRLERKILPGWTPKIKGAVEPLHRRKYPPQIEMVVALAKHNGWNKEEIQKNIQKNAIKGKWKKMVAEKVIPMPPPPPEPQNIVQKLPDKAKPLPQHGKQFLHITGNDHNKPRPRKNRVGRPSLALPVGKILKLFKEGNSPDKLLKVFETEKIKVSRRTLYNILAGQKELPL